MKRIDCFGQFPANWFWVNHSQAKNLRTLSESDFSETSKVVVCLNFRDVKLAFGIRVL